MTFLERLGAKSIYRILLEIANTGRFKKEDSMDCSKTKKQFRVSPGQRRKDRLA